MWNLDPETCTWKRSAHPGRGVRCVTAPLHALAPFNRGGWGWGELASYCAARHASVIASPRPPQHVNTTDSAVRVTHVPTGTVVAIQDERSQHQNKEKAVRLLRSRLFEERRQRAMAERSAHRIAQIGTGDRSERIRTYNYPQGRVTDHRIGCTVNNLTAVLEGRGLEDIIDALASEENMRKLEQMKEEVGGRA